MVHIHYVCIRCLQQFLTIETLIFVIFCQFGLVYC